MSQKLADAFDKLLMRSSVSTM